MTKPTSNPNPNPFTCNALSRLFSLILDLIFPPRCASCGNFSYEGICADCIKQINCLGNDICRICGEPRDKYFINDLCEDCHKLRPPFICARSVAIYEGVLKESIHKFKFENKIDLYPVLGRLLVNYVSSGKLSVQNIDSVIPVPLSIKRIHERGYNQSELLARVVADHFSLKMEVNLLKKIKEIKPQFKLEREERLSNIKGAFSCSPLEGKNVLLIDDIYTTGATVLEASSALKAAGAKHIYILTLARAVEA